MKNSNKKYFVYLKKYEFIFTGLTVILFTIFLTVKLMIPNIIKAREIMNNKEILNKKLATLEKKNNILNSLDETLIRDNFIKLNYIVPENKDYALLFTTLDNLQERLGVAITRTDFELGSVSTSTSSSTLKKGKKSDDNSIPINFEVIGNAEQLQSFLTYLSDLSGRLITVNSIKLELLENGGIKAVISGNTYFNPLLKNIGAVDTAIPEFNENYKTIYERILDQQFPLSILEETNQEVPVGKENLFL